MAAVGIQSMVVDCDIQFIVVAGRLYLKASIDSFEEERVHLLFPAVAGNDYSCF